MRIFLCWSGTRSLAITKALKSFLLQLNRSLELKGERLFDPFYSADIEKGLLWFQAVGDELTSADAALITVTPENATSAWMHYEAGAIGHQLSRRRNPNETSAETLKASVFTYLFGMEARELNGPLSSFQATLATFDDTRALVRQWLGLNGPGNGGENPETPAKWNEDRFLQCWNGLAEQLRLSRSQPLAEAMPRFEDKFRRKTFQEPFASCHRQAWVDRINGCHEVLVDLRSHLEMVKQRCSLNEVELYRQLLASLDEYEMAMQAYLVTERKFDPDKNGRLILPPGVEFACESLRRSVKDGVAALLDPQRAPVFEESPAFSRLETFAEKKNVIHRKTAAIHRWIEQTRQGPETKISPLLRAANHEPDPERTIGLDWRVAAALPPPDELIRARTSEWDFDRIVHYLVHSECVRHRFEPDESSSNYGIRTGPDLEARMCEWLVDEVQKIEAAANEKTATRMPLSYALEVLEAIHEVRRESGLLAGQWLQPALASRIIPVLQNIIRLEAGRESKLGARANLLLTSLGEAA